MENDLLHGVSWNNSDESFFLKDRLWSEQDAQIEAQAQEQMSEFTCNGLQVFVFLIINNLINLT